MSGREALTDAEMADYVRDHRCYAARRDLSIADWDRGVAAIEAAAAREALPSVEEMVAANIAATPPEHHGQLCPTWAHRNFPKRISRECDCFISEGWVGHRVTVQMLLEALRADRASDGGR